MYKLVNLTPHDVNIVANDGTLLHTFPAQKPSARVSTQFIELEPINGIPVYETVYGVTEDLPEYDEYNDDTYYIVSMMVAQANTDRYDLICPNTAPGHVVRDDKGQIVGVTSFTSYAE